MKLSIGIFIGVSICAIAASAQTIENVRAQQRPRSKIVEVYYDLVAEDGAVFDVSVSFSAPGKHPNAVTLEGDVGEGVLPGRNKRIFWDAGTDWPDNKADDFTVEIRSNIMEFPDAKMVRVPGGTLSGTGDGWNLCQFSVPYLEPPEYHNSNYILEVSVRSEITPYWEGANAGCFSYEYSYKTSGFWMDATEVTYAHYSKVFDWAIKNGYEFEYNGFGKADNHPICNISAYDILKWCNARSEMEGKIPVYMINEDIYRKGKASPVIRSEADGYRVPTFEEWQYAARGGISGQIFPTGDTLSHSVANYNGSVGEHNEVTEIKYGNNILGTPSFQIVGWNYATYTGYWAHDGNGHHVGEYYGYVAGFKAIMIQVFPVMDVGYCPIGNDGVFPYTTAVGSFPANPYGLYDMAGNVSEFCYDGGTTGGWIGGNWSGSGAACSFYSFYKNQKQQFSSGAPSTTQGFRCVRK